MRAGCSGDSEDDEYVVPTTSTSDALTSTNSEAPVGRSGNAPSTAKCSWTTRGIQDWNHATEQLKQHSQSKCHRDAVIHARMAEQGKEQSVLQLQCSAAAKEAEERSAKNRNIVRF